MALIQKKSGLFILILSVVLGLVPFLNTIYSNWMQDQLIHKWQTNTHMNENVNDIINLNPVKVYYAQRKKVKALEYDANDNWEKGETIGVIEIEKINVNLPIIQGSDDEALKKGIGHIEGSCMPGQIGNCALAGHRSYTYGSMFNRLNEVEIGDTVKILYKKEVLKYKVYSILIVEPNDLSVLNKNDTDKILTLITCHPIRIANKRLIIHCILE